MTKKLISFIAVTLCTLFIKVSCTNLIHTENKLNGTRSWWYPQSQFLAPPLLEGFTTSFSYKANETVRLKISSHFNVTSYIVNVYRLGYYNGDGGRLLTSIPILKAIQQSKCNFYRVSRMTDCSNWEVSAEWIVPSDAVSGVYIVLPSTVIGGVVHYGSYIPFVVKQPLNTASSNILFKTSDLTWVAYNLYGGYNVYKSSTDRSFSARATQASYNRPFQNRAIFPNGQHQNFLFGTEYGMLRWLEKHGYDVSYVSCADFEELHRAKLLVPSRFKAVLSVGHDEYWTQGIFDGHRAARDNGVNVAFFSGNEAFWRVMWSNSQSAVSEVATLNKVNRSVSSSVGGSTVHSAPCDLCDDSPATRHRIVICRKESIENTPPLSADEWTGTFMDPRHRAPEPQNSLTGQLFMVNSMQSESIEVQREDAGLWFWRDTAVSKAVQRNSLSSVLSNSIQGLLQQRQSGRRKDGETVYSSPAAYVGYEFDVFVDDCYRPPGLFTLSHTRKNVSGSLLETYGAAYRGSGVVSHKLSLYRHVVRSGVVHADVDKETLAKNVETRCAAALSRASTSGDKDTNKQSEKPQSSLVFGAGTIQWAWGLSAWHDGLSSYQNGVVVPADPVIRQATMNLLADMDCFPSTRVLTNQESAAASRKGTDSARESLIRVTAQDSLVFPTVSSDFLPPKSTIAPSKMRLGTASAPLHVHRNTVITIRGTAKDSGGGKVAAVEVSTNGGRNWHLATGREHWHFRFKFHHTDYSAEHHIGEHNCSAKNERDSAMIAAASGLSQAEQFVSALIADHKLYDEYSSHHYHWTRTRRNSNQSHDSTPHAAAAAANAYHDRPMRLLLLSRAVDDRGWMESVSLEKAVCALTSDDPHAHIPRHGNAEIVHILLSGPKHSHRV